VQLAPVNAYRDRWQTPHERDPFAVPMAEKLDLLRRVSEEAKKGAKVFSSNATLSVRSEDKYFASTEGSSPTQINSISHGCAPARLRDGKEGLILLDRRSLGLPGCRTRGLCVSSAPDSREACHQFCHFMDTPALYANINPP